jgi:hypothetical protein
MKNVLTISFFIASMFVFTWFLQSCGTSMMDDPNTNYHKAVENFEKFWKDKRKPITEGELFENAEKLGTDKSLKGYADSDEPAIKYHFEYKKFKHWQQDIVAFVQPNGSILTMDERLKIIAQQQKESKKNK